MLLVSPQPQMPLPSICARETFKTLRFPQEFPLLMWTHLQGLELLGCGPSTRPQMLRRSSKAPALASTSRGLSQRWSRAPRDSQGQTSLALTAGAFLAEGQPQDKHLSSRGWEKQDCVFSVFSDSLLLKRSLDKEEPLESNSCKSITVAIRIHEIGYMNVYIYIY